jgi:hypothetical protein
MVGVRGFGYSDYTPQEIWQNAEYEYDGLFFFRSSCGQGEAVRRTGNLEGGKLQEASGYVSCFFSFAGAKHTDFENTRDAADKLIEDLYNRHVWMLRLEMFTDSDRADFFSIDAQMPEAEAAFRISKMWEWLYRYYGKEESCFWMNTTHLCRRHMLMAFGMS